MMSAIHPLIKFLIPIRIRKKEKADTGRDSVFGQFREQIRQQYRKWLLVFLAAAFFASVLYLVDRLPVPKIRKSTPAETEAVVSSAAPKKSSGRQVLIGCAVGLLMAAVVGAGIWAMIRKNGGRSAKESVGMEENLVAEDGIAAAGEELWSLSSDTVLVLPEETAEPVAESVSEDVAEEPAEEEATDEYVMPARQAINGDVIFVGDSRFVGMSMAMRFDDLYIAQVAIGYDWFRDTAVPEIDRVAVPGSRIVINMGVNDLENAGRYASLINECMDRWTAGGITVYYMSVNPVIDGKSYATNAMIETFNAKMQETLDARVQWIDTYTPLMESGIHSPDGVHYREDTSRLIYEYCRVALEESAAQMPAIRQLELQPTEEGLPEGALPEGILPEGALQELPQGDLPTEGTLQIPQPETQEPIIQ